ncbi:hypothetical protein EUAN_13470 [Andreesenia angusta]|uniref:Uncharacterized protein n=1 Tax=Andreesenia angusta TaxID=39480 RepID=A0A1S1V801_9FIRM|nr:hypothetical protein [Andreesenia angusta]OHW62277.1 hypothetical protein EUAN_13470 [Andreesenia angusta]
METYNIVENSDGKLIVKRSIPSRRNLLIAALVVPSPFVPVTKELIDEIRVVGKKEGYERASIEYEKKLLEQSRKFSEKQQEYRAEQRRYEALISEYELRIEDILSCEEELNLTKSLDLAKLGALYGGMLESIILYNKPHPLIENVREEGRKEGYMWASIEYENKLLKQAESFLKQEKTSIVERNKYEELISDYKSYVRKLSR